MAEIPTQRSSPTARILESRASVVRKEPVSELGQTVAVPAPMAIAERRVLRMAPTREAAPPGPPAAPSVTRSGIAIIGRFEPFPWKRRPKEMFLADALESIGVKVHRIDQYSAVRPALAAEWALFTDDPLSWRRIPRWADTHRTALWTLDWMPGFAERRPVVEAARSVDLLVTADKFDWGPWGMKAHLYLPGACEPEEPRFDPRPSIKCAFMGSIYNERRRRIADVVSRIGGEVLDRPGSWLYGAALAEFVQRVKVVVGDNARNDVPGHWSSRNYVVPGAGGFLLAPQVPGMESDFEPGRHICAYSSIDVIEEAVEACAAHDDEREGIRRAGFLHVRGRHNWAARAAVLAARMGVAVAPVR